MVDKGFNFDVLMGGDKQSGFLLCCLDWKKNIIKQILVSHSSRGWKSKIKVPADSMFIKFSFIFHDFLFFATFYLI